MDAGLIDQVSRLSKLRSEGFLSESEFEKCKAELLQGRSSPSAQIHPTKYNGRKFFLISVATLGGAMLMFMLTPQVLQGTGDPCLALEIRAKRQVSGNPIG